MTNMTTDESEDVRSIAKTTTNSTCTQADADESHGRPDLRCWTVYPSSGAAMDVRLGGYRVENPGGVR
jgi:hypothetical protein